MASTIRYQWNTQDTIWHVAARYLRASGFADVPTLVLAIRAANKQILDWTAVPVTTAIIVPFATN